MLEPTDEYTTVAGKIFGVVVGLGGLAVAALNKWKKEKVDSGSQTLDLTSLESATKQLTNLSNELDRTRQDSINANSIAQKRIADIQERLDAVQTQLDAEMAKRRSAEDTISRLRMQIRALGKEPEA